MSTSTEVSNTTVTETEWTGLTRDELLNLVLEITPPLHRSTKYKASCPTEAASKLISYLIEEVIEAGIALREPHRRGSSSISQQLKRVLVDVSKPYVSTLKQGSLRVQDDDRVSWGRLRMAFRWLLRGSGKAGAGDARNELWVDKLTRYFFEKEAQPTAFFAREALGNGSPRGIEEGVFNVLWTADQVLRFGMQCCITAVSGEMSFTHVNEQALLTESGKALVLAAAAGVRLIYVFPKSINGSCTPAEESARKFFTAAQSFVNSDEWPWESDCVFARLFVEKRDALRRNAMSNILLRPVPRDKAGLLPGFFCPGFRFSSIRSYRGGAVEWRACFLIRATDAQPSAIECNKIEESRFFEWCKGLDLPVDPTIDVNKPKVSIMLESPSLAAASNTSRKRQVSGRA